MRMKLLIILFVLGSIYAIFSRMNFLPNIMADQTIANRLFKDIPKDGEIINYLGKKYSKAEYNQVKHNELIQFKDRLKKQYGLTFKTRSSKYFNIAYLCPEEKMNHLELYLDKFFEQVYTKYFKYEPQYAFKIVYFNDKNSYLKHTESNAYGFYSPADKTLTTYAYSGHGTLWHEMIHAFMDANLDTETQQWFSEGFASFYEMAFLDNNRVIEGYTNWRMPELQQVIYNKKFPSVKKFMLDQIMEEDFGYAEARFLFCHLWVNNKMVPFVKAYLYELCPKYKGKQLGLKAIEKMEELLGKNIDEINKEYIAMAKQVKKNQKLTQRLNKQ